jgi:alkylated DNA repair protein alkB family protein 1
MRAQASIINFYASTKDKMGAHVDDSEKDMSKPIVSFSWGNTVGIEALLVLFYFIVCCFSLAVFLLGGRTKETAPMPILIRSGDVIMMSGETRYAFHSVPRMIENTTPGMNALLQSSPFADDVDFILNNADDDWKDEQEYITGARINMNCRQVMMDNETEF